MRRDPAWGYSPRRGQPLLLGYSNAARRPGRPITLGHEDRFAHVYLIGRTGVGKSYLLQQMARQDLSAGRGFIIIDPHGDLAHGIKAVDHENHALYVNAARARFRFNPLSSPLDTPPALTVAIVLSVFQKLWEDSWGPRLEHLLRNVLFTLVAHDHLTLGDVPRLLVDKDYRAPLVRAVEDRAVKGFWWDEYASYSPGFRSVVIAPLQNKLGALLTDPRLRSILDTPKTSVDLDRAMAEGQAILINLNKGELGEGPATLLGGLITARLTLAGLARSRFSETDRRAFFVYLDEFPSFATSLLATGLSELRKYRVGFTLAHQYLSQLDPFIRDAALGNVGTTLCFRVGAKDAPLLAGELAPTFEPVDLVRLPNRMVYARMLVDGQVSRPFSFATSWRGSTPPY